jgi:putative phage-type endonuclease
MAGAGSSGDPIVLSDDEGVIPVVRIAQSDLSRRLLIQESTIIPGQPGLFTTESIPPNSLVCVYTYDRVLSGTQLNALSSARRYAISKYAVAGPSGLTLVVDTPPITDSSRHVAALANEPSEGQTANMQLHAEEITLPNGMEYYVVALYTCDSTVVAGAELTWHYNSSYEAVRRREGYRAGRPCTSNEPLNPGLDDLVARILATRGPDGVEGVLLRMEDDTSSSSGSDPDYSPAPRKRRTSTWIDSLVNKRMLQLQLRPRGHVPFRPSPLSIAMKRGRIDESDEDEEAVDDTALFAARDRAGELVREFERLAPDYDILGAMQLLNEAHRVLGALNSDIDQHSQIPEDDLRMWVKYTIEEARTFLADQCGGQLLVWDLETDRLVPTHGSGYKLEDLRATILAVLVIDPKLAASNPSEAIRSAERYEFWHSEADGAPVELFQSCLDACLAHVAYNGVHFDMAVVKKHYADGVGQWQAHVDAIVDPLVGIRSATGRRWKLDQLLAANGLDGKTDSGAMAPTMWVERDLERLRSYCFSDCERLAELVLRPRIRLPDAVRGVDSVESRAFRAVGGTAAADSSDGGSQSSEGKAVVQRSPEWFALRRNRVTSTLVAAICGLSPFASREDAHETLRGEAEPPQETESMRRGIQREAEAIQRYETAIGNRIESVGFVIPTDPRYKDWVGASPDGLGKDDKKLCVEVKVPANGRPTPKPSPAYFLQCQWHMFCSGRLYCDFVSLGTDSMSITRVRRDEDLLRYLHPHLRAFWEHAQTDDEFELELDMRDRIAIREEVGASLAESIGAAKIVRIKSI